MQTGWLSRFVLLTAACVQLAWTPTARAIDSAKAQALFADPPAEYAVAPLWVWNDLLTDQQIRDTLHDLAEQKVMQVFVHPRPGLMTPYLSDDWFKLWQVALDEGRKLGMRVWIYDENSYPSGFAGGFVPDQMPESRGRGLSLRDQPPGSGEELIAVYQPDGNGFKNITDQAKGGVPEGKNLFAVMVRAPKTPWNAGKTYVDLMYPGVTEKFLDITHEAYRRHIGDEFGKMVPGSFTDEPELRPAGALPWTPDLPQRFAQQWKYNLLDVLPSLTRDVGEFRKIRHDYVYMLNKLFIERWAKPYSEWCERNHIEFTGHYWEHDWPNVLSVPDNMAMYAWHQCPAIDNLMNTYSETLHAQFGNTRTVRELGSVANQMGRSRTLCEAYGAGGWDLRFEDMKRIGDWLYVLGVNTLDPHLSYITIRGARKRDHPQSFSYHEPWWEAYHISAQYFARLSAAMSQGRQENNILIIEPTTTAWMYDNDNGKNPPLVELGTTFEQLIRDLEQAQVEYDLGSEDVIARNGAVGKGTFQVGKCGYRVVVVPQHTENLEGRTVELLEQFMNAGGTVVCIGDAPTLVDARPSDRLAGLTGHRTWTKWAPKEAVKLLRGRQRAQAVSVVAKEGAEGQLYHHRRVIDDGNLLLLVNTRIDKPAAGTVSTKGKGIQKWDLMTGKVETLSGRQEERRLRYDFELPPCGSLLLFVTDKPLEPAATASAGVVSKITSDAPPEIKRLDPNVLTLDYVDATCRGEAKKGTPAIKAGHWIFAKHGFERNPWDRAVQFKDELITKTFPADSGFEATYRFTIAETVPASLFAVVERADLYTITCNGKPVSTPGTGATGNLSASATWYLDKAFNKIDIAGAAKVGDNALTIKASPMTMYHELEAAYIIGEFGLKPIDHGFAIVPATPLKLGPWNNQGCKLYGHRVSYKQKFNVSGTSGKYCVELPNWYGSVAKVVVNGKPAGYIGWRPWQCDVTGQIVSGSNEIEVIVFGTLRNTLGPTHNPQLGLTWPGMWDADPDNGPPAGAKYFGVGYGLMEPFVLVHE